MANVIYGIMRFPDGLEAPYYRTLIVDQGGRGNYTTIQAAIAYAVTQQTGAFERWGIVVNPGVYTEAVEVTRGIQVLGSGQGGVTSIVGVGGPTIVHAGASIHRCTISFTGAGTSAVHLVTDAVGFAASLYFCYIVHSNNTDAPAVAIYQSGTALASQGLVFGCFAYAQADSNTSNAWAIGARLTGSNYLEILTGRTKLSSRAAGGARIGWNQASGADATIQNDTTAIFARTDGAAVYTVRNENATANHRGMQFTGRVLPPVTGTPMTLNHTEVEFDAGVGTSLGLPELHGRKVFSGGLEVFSDGLRSTSFMPRRTGVAFTSQFATSKVALALTSGQARAFPMVIGVATTLTSAAIDVTTAVVASTIAAAIYADDNGRPGAKVTDLPNFSGATAGLTTPANTISVALSPGLYWVAVGTTATGVSLRAGAGHAWMLPQTTASFRFAAYHASYAGTFASTWPYLGEADNAALVYFTT